EPLEHVPRIADPRLGCATRHSAVLQPGHVAPAGSTLWLLLDCLLASPETGRGNPGERLGLFIPAHLFLDPAPANIQWWWRADGSSRRVLSSSRTAVAAARRRRPGALARGCPARGGSARSTRSSAGGAARSRAGAARFARSRDPADREPGRTAAAP